MKNILFAATTIILLSFCVFAQTNKPDFSGTWVLDREASFSDKKTRENYEDYTLVIAHTGEEFKVKKSIAYRAMKTDQELILFTDERGEKNALAMYGDAGSTREIEIKSKTLMKKNSIIRRFETIGAGGTRLLIRSEKYSLSDDGKTLTVVTESDRAQFDVRADAPIEASLPSVRRLVFRKK